MRLYEIDDFGGIDADTDALLRDCFQDHASYRDALNHRRYVIVGRKGSGKTAIFTKLQSIHSSSVFTYGHTFDDYPWSYHDKQAESGVPEEHRYIQSWKYLIWLSLGKILLNYDQAVPWDEHSMDAVEKLESFIVDSYGSRDPDLTQLFTPDKEIKLKGGFKALFASVDIERLRVSDLPTHFQEINRQVGSAVIDSLHPGHDYYICFDQLDLGFSLSNEKFGHRLIGLILAARQINLAAKRAGKNMSVLVFIRDDIYDLLHFEDKNKITENHVSRIEWKPHGDDLTLIDLMEKRFQRALGRESGVSWAEMFDETQEMPSRQRKYDHICDRTLWRPRDMIKFCNEVLSSYKSSEGRASKFRNADVISARESYSDYLLRELEDEITKHVPEYREYLEVIKSIGKTQFSPRQFEEAWCQRPSLKEKPHQEALIDLFEFSVIGYLRPGGGGGGSRYVWRYQDNRAKFNPEAELLKVHPGFKESLDIAQGKAAE